jgi:Replication protein
VSAALAGLVPAGDTVGNTRTTDRIKARAYLRDFSRLRRVQDCGHALGGAVTVRHGPTGGVSGLTTCGSVWACPVCSAKIAKGRTDEVEAGIRQWVDSDGGSVALLTLTMRHTRGDRLSDLWDAVSRVWRTFVGHRAYRSARKRLGVAGYLRTTEVVYSEEGWHVHLHVLYFLNGRPSPDASADFGGRLISLWSAAAAHHGYYAHALGQDWKTLSGTAEALEGVAGYLTKATYEKRLTNARSLAMETTRGDLKDYRFNGSRTPWQLLDETLAVLVTDGVLGGDSYRLWSEYEKASKGRRQHTWSRGLRHALQLDEPATDEELAAEAPIQGEDLCRLTAKNWRKVSRVGAWHVRLLTLAASGPFDQSQAAVFEFLDSIHVAYMLPADLDDGPALARDYWRKRRAPRAA